MFVSSSVAFRDLLFHGRPGPARKQWVVSFPVPRIISQPLSPIGYTWWIYACPQGALRNTEWRSHNANYVARVLYDPTHVVVLGTSCLWGLKNESGERQIMALWTIHTTLVSALNQGEKRHIAQMKKWPVHCSPVWLLIFAKVQQNRKVKNDKNRIMCIVLICNTFLCLRYSGNLIEERRFVPLMLDYLFRSPFSRFSPGLFLSKSHYCCICDAKKRTSRAWSIYWLNRTLFFLDFRPIFKGIVAPW